jgi:hypothetical protein
MKRAISTKVIDIDDVDGVIDSFKRAIERDAFTTIDDYNRCFDRMRQNKPKPCNYRVTITIEQTTEDT